MCVCAFQCQSVKDANKWRFIHFLWCFAEKKELLQSFLWILPFVFVYIFYFSYFLFILFSFLLHEVCHSVWLSSVRVRYNTVRISWIANMFVPFGCLCRGNILGCYVSLLICTFDVMEHRHRQRIMLQVFLSISCWLLLVLVLMFVRPNVIRSFVLLEIQSLAAMQKSRCHTS